MRAGDISLVVVVGNVVVIVVVPRPVVIVFVVGFSHQMLTFFAGMLGQAVVLENWFFLVPSLA